MEYFPGDGLLLAVGILCCLALFLPTACWLVLSWSKKSNRDGSYRTRGAPKSVEEGETDWVLPFQILENLPKGEYIRNASGTEISVDILPHESIYGEMQLSLSSYYSRVYKLKKCDTKDIDTLKIALSRALGAYPIMAGRFRQTIGRDRAVVLPTEYLVANEKSNHQAIGPHFIQNGRGKAFGVPFRVYRIDESMSKLVPTEGPLSPLDAARYSVYEDPSDVMRGKGPICTVCVYLLPDGSATLALVISHAVMDGVSIAGFEQVWAEESRKLFEVDPPAERTDPTAWYPHHKPLTLVPPVQRSYVAGPFENMEDYRSAQLEFFGHIFDDGPCINGSLWQRFVGWLMIEALMPYLRFFDNFSYLWERHPDQYRPSVSISKAKIQELKEMAMPSKPDWIASQDALVAVLAMKLLEIRKRQKKQSKKKRLRIVLFRDARSFVGLTSNHAYGLGVLNWPIDIEDPDELSLSGMAIKIRRGLLEMQDNEKGLRFWRLTTTVFERRRWAFLSFVHKGLYDEGNSDARMMLNNSLFPLPDFGGGMGQALSLATSAGPSIMLPLADGGCQLIIEKELANILTKEELESAFG